MTQSNDEDWRAIVENFGETPDAESIAAEVDSAQAATSEAKPTPPDPVPPFDGALWTGESWEDEGRFIPPPPPPLPRLPIRQRIAWVALIGGPALLLVCLFTGIRPPLFVVMIDLAAIVGSFVYLLFGTPRQPREPWEDGAQV